MRNLPMLLMLKTSPVTLIHWNKNVTLKPMQEADIATPKTMYHNYKLAVMNGYVYKSHLSLVCRRCCVTTSRACRRTEAVICQLPLYLLSVDPNNRQFVDAIMGYNYMGRVISPICEGQCSFRSWRINNYCNFTHVLCVNLWITWIKKLIVYHGNFVIRDFIVNI